MADVERIAPPVPTLPPPVGRNVGSRQRRQPPPEHSQDEQPGDRSGPSLPPNSEHIDEYV